MGGTRPYGAALLIGGIDGGVGGDNGRPRLFGADPSGSPHEWKASVIGGGRQEIQEVFEDEWVEGLSLDEGLELALSGLQTHEPELEAADLTVGAITVDTGWEVYETGEVADLLESLPANDE